MFNFVYPYKIACTVISFIAIDVMNFAPTWSRAKKGFRYQAMHIAFVPCVMYI